MPESETVISTDSIDEAFAEAVSLLYGDAVDVREISKAVSAEDKKRQRTQAQVGLASNVLGLAAGVGGTAAALRDDRLRHKKAPKALRAIGEAGKKIPAPISSKGGRAGAMLAGGALGLQVANIGGDVVANRVLSREAKKKEIKKAWDEGLNEILAARKAGVIDRETAVEMGVTLAKSLEGELEEISKWTPPGIARGAKKAATEPWFFAVAPTKRPGKVARGANLRLNPVHRANVRASSATAVAADAAKGKKYLFRGSLAGGAAVGGGAGYAAGKKKGRRQVVGVAKADGSATAQAEVIPEEQVDYGFTGEISKFDSDKRLAFGWCSLSEIDGQPVVDLQNDYAPIEEIEKSAYAYVVDSRKGGDMHERDGDGPRHTADLVESMIVTPEKLQLMGLREDVAKSVPTGWWVGFKVNDDRQWQMVKNGERTGFSIHGKGSRVSKVLT